MRRAHWLALLFMGFSCRLDAQATSSLDDSLLRAIEAQEQAVSEGGLSPEVRGKILDKPRIAEETERRLIGLREAGNPHIQKGDGLLLPGAQEAPRAKQVDLAALRERQLARFERRPLRAASATPATLARADEAVAPPTLGAATAGPAGNVEDPWVLVGVAVVSLAMLAAAVWALRGSNLSRPRAPQAPSPRGARNGG